MKPLQDVTIGDLRYALSELGEFQDGALDTAYVALTSEEDIAPEHIPSLLRRSANVLFDLNTYIRMASLTSLIHLLESTIIVKLPGKFFAQEAEEVEVPLSVVTDFLLSYTLLSETLSISYKGETLPIRQFGAELSRVLEITNNIASICDELVGHTDVMKVIETAQAAYPAILEYAYIQTIIQYAAERASVADTVFSSEGLH